MVTVINSTQSRPTNAVGFVSQNSVLEREYDEKRENEQVLQKAHKLFHGGVTKGDKRVVFPTDGKITSIQVSNYPSKGVAEVCAWLMRQANAAAAAAQVSSTGFTPRLA